MRLVSWNVAGRTDGPRAARLSAQADAIASERPDLVALQEVTCATDAPWREKLRQVGLEHCASTVDRLPGAGRYANLLASRWPLSSEPSARDTELPEKLLSASVAAPGGAVEMHVFHAPTGVGSGWGKVDALEALHLRLSEPSAAPRIVCGDFNAPQDEPPGRPLVTFAQDPTGALLDRPPRWFTALGASEPWDARRWDRAERQVLAPQRLGLVDVFRLMHPDARDATWIWRGRGREVPRRFDHVFASATLRPVMMRYRHDWRERDPSGVRLSDHSGAVAAFVRPKAPA